MKSLKNFHILSAACLAIAMGFALTGCDTREVQPPAPPAEPCPDGVVREVFLDGAGEWVVICSPPEPSLEEVQP